MSHPALRPPGRLARFGATLVMLVAASTGCSGGPGAPGMRGAAGASPHPAPRSLLAPPPAPPPAPAPAPESVGLSSAALARLDAVLTGFVERGQIPGYQLLVARRGRVVHESVVGQLDHERERPLRPDTIYRIYSMSKVVTGVATMIAWERGDFLLNDPVSKYLPALADPQVLLVDGDGSTRSVPAEREITILDLLRHTSGIPYHFTAPPALRERFLEAGITPGLRPLPVDTILGNAAPDQDATLADMVERLGELPLVIQPGTAWHYGINMDVLGRLIEVVSGQSFPDFLEEHLFAPLGMRDTAFHVPADRLDRFAACYLATEDGGMRLADDPETSSYREPPAMPGGGGGLVSTAEDYMRFARMLLGGGELDGVRILGPRTVELMRSNHLPPAVFGENPLRFSIGDTFANDGRGLGFGLTGSVVTEPAWTGLPASRGSFGWGGAASTYFWIDPEEDLAVVFMTQLLMSNTYPLRAHLIKGVGAALLD